MPPGITGTIGGGSTVPATVISPASCAHPITLSDFARSFKPAPGTYKVTFLHPVKCCPVEVCFTLPCGCPHVCVGKRELVFDYGCQQVAIRFKLLCGGVRVNYY